MLSLGIGNAFAEQSGFVPSEPSGLYAFRIQGVPVERGGQGTDVPRPQSPEARRSKYVTLPDTSGYSTLNDNKMTSADNSRRGGRMSPEERRALRRQIDEAGHDLYTPKR